MALDPADADLDEFLQLMEYFKKLAGDRRLAIARAGRLAHLDQALAVAVNTNVSEPLGYAELDGFDDGNCLGLGIIIAVAGEAAACLLDQFAVLVEEANADTTVISPHACVAVTNCLNFFLILHAIGFVAFKRSLS